MTGKGIAVGAVFLAASMMVTGCGNGAGAPPADPPGTVEPAPAVQPAPQIECPSAAATAPAAQVEVVEPVPAGQSAAPDQPVPPNEADSEATPVDPDPCGLSTSHSAGPAEPGYWTQERMDSATAAPMPVEDEPRR